MTNEMVPAWRCGGCGRWVGGDVPFHVHGHIYHWNPVINNGKVMADAC